MKQYPQVIGALCGQAWAIQPEKMDAILAFLNHRLSTGNSLAIDAAQKSATSFRNVSGNIAIVPVYGTIMPHPDIMNEFSGGTSTDAIGAMFDRAMADPSVGAVILDVHSPGGSVYGVQELSNKIYGARGIKPIVAMVNSFDASAALWITSAADEIVMSPSSEIGSIGVLAIHQEASRLEEAMGVKTTIVKAGQFKAEANEHEPLSDDARGSIQSAVDRYYTSFVADIARNRGVTAAYVEKNFGQGRMMGAEEAVKVGLADRIGTLEDVILGMQTKTAAKRKNIAADLEILKLS